MDTCKIKVGELQTEHTGAHTRDQASNRTQTLTEDHGLGGLQTEHTGTCTHIHKTKVSRFQTVHNAHTCQSRLVGFKQNRAVLFTSLAVIRV